MNAHAIPCIPVSVVVPTKNEERRIGPCLDHLHRVQNVFVVDSNSTDNTATIAQGYTNVRLVPFQWDGRYPKKYQWCLDTLPLSHDWVLFVDADERIPPQLIDEIATLFKTSQDTRAGYFIRAHYKWGEAGRERILRYGLTNNKLCLINRHKMEFPVIHDLDIEGMGEIEGHYQPVLKDNYKDHIIGQLKTPMIHDCTGPYDHWLERHKRYAKWEAEMDARRAWPQEDRRRRRWIKRAFKSLPFRPVLAFMQCYILKLGFVDGALGLHFARSRARYYKMITHEKRKLSKGR